MRPPHLTRDLARTWRWAGLLTLLSVVALVAMLPGPVRDAVASVDRAWHGLMVDLYARPVAEATIWFTALGGVWVTLPLRVVVSVALALRRTWARLAVWLSTIVVSEIALTVLKVAYDRPRPPLGLAGTTGASFPSGHAVASAVTAIALVAVLTSSRARRWHWWGVAVSFAAAMAFSRTYLRVHWLSDVVVGTLLGATIGLVCVATVETARLRWSGSRSDRDTAPGPQAPSSLSTPGR